MRVQRRIGSETRNRHTPNLRKECAQSLGEKPLASRPPKQAHPLAEIQRTESVYPATKQLKRPDRVFPVTVGVQVKAQRISRGGLSFRAGTKTGPRPDNTAEEKELSAN